MPSGPFRRLPAAGHESEVAPVLAMYPLRSIESVVSLGNAGGFSGAQFWKVTGPQSWCLRRWPRSQPSRDRLVWIHRCLATALRSGIQAVACPIANRDGATISVHRHHLWEISEWKPGSPCASDESGSVDPQIVAAIVKAAARLHAAFADTSNSVEARSGGIRERIELLRAVPTTTKKLLAVQTGTSPSAARALAAFRQPGIHQRILQSAAKHAGQLMALDRPLRLQPVVRDLRKDNFLLDQFAVTGIIDFGGMSLDTVALDLARLLDSLIPGQYAEWEPALEIYTSVASLDERERPLLPVLMETNLLLSWLNWLRWLVLENRQFDDPEGALHRFHELHRRIAAGDIEHP